MEPDAPPRPYQLLLRDLCRILGLEDDAIGPHAPIEVDGAIFHLLHHGSADPHGMTVALDLGELPAATREHVACAWLKANSSRPVTQGAFALLEHNGHGAIVRRIALDEGHCDGHRLASMMIAWAAEHRAAGPAVEICA